MKKTILFVLCFALVIALTACGEKKTVSNVLGEDNNLGLTITAKNEAATGLTLVFTQADGNPTGNLQTGSDFSIEKKENGKWKLVKTLIPSDKVAWTAEAYLIGKNCTTEMVIDWSFLYGELEPGNYRIQKNIMDFRGSGDYDIVSLVAEFVIQ